METITQVSTLISTNAPQLIGFLMPFLVEVLNKDVQNTKERAFVALGACFIAAVILKWQSVLYGSPQEVLWSTGLIFGESQAMFKLYFQDSWARWKLQGLIGVGQEKKEELPPLG